MVDYTLGDGDTTLTYRIGEGLPEEAITEIHVAMQGVYDAELARYNTNTELACSAQTKS